MFSALLYVRDQAAGQVLEELADASGLVNIQKSHNTFPQNYELAVHLNTHDPDLVFIDLGDWDSAVAAAMMIRTQAPRTAIIGFGAGWSDQIAQWCEQA